MTTQEKLAYCAGLLDGEGYIGIRKFIDRRVRKSGESPLRPRYELHVEINQVRPECIRVAYELFGGQVTFTARNGKYSGRWFWKIDSQKAADCLHSLLPFLKLKDNEARIAISFQQTKLSMHSGRSFKRGRTNAEIAHQEGLYLQLKQMKRLHNNPAIQAHYASLASYS